MRIIGELFKNVRDKEAPLYLFASFADDVLLLMTAKLQKATAILTLFACVQM